MNNTRRDFLKGTAWMGVTAMAAGCMSGALKITGGGTMLNWADKPLKKLRVGVIGLGMRGPGALHILAIIPGVEIVALCDKHPERVAMQQKWLRDNGHSPAKKEFSGEEGYKKLCEEADIDLVYNATPWHLHVPIALYAMEHGKHVATEVPAAFTIEDCWKLVETSERTRRHCMQLENCCYGEIEMLTLNMARKGILGELLHAECAYIHDLRECCYQDPDVNKPGYGVSGYMDYWRLKWNLAHKGNQYPTHGLGPVAWYFDINRGDRFDYLVSLESKAFGFKDYASARFPETWKARQNPAMGDMNTTLVKTVKGRSIMIQHDVTSPRPYSRINLVSGSRGILKDYPYQVALSKKRGDGAHEWESAESAEKIRKEYMHPLWKEAGEFAKVVGGHGGMDFLMILRLCYCLQNGLPLDMDVYDLAAWCSVCELSERSVRNRSATQDMPDFTKGAWMSGRPVVIEPVGLEKMGFKRDGEIKKDSAQLSV